MTEKAKRTKIELTALIVQEIKKYPECRDIQDVLIERQQVPNWRCSWIMDGAAPRPARALEIERMLQDQFDLV